MRDGQREIGARYRDSATDVFRFWRVVVMGIFIFLPALSTKERRERRRSDERETLLLCRYLNFERVGE